MTNGKYISIDAKIISVEKIKGVSSLTGRYVDREGPKDFYEIEVAELNENYGPRLLFTSSEAKRLANELNVNGVDNLVNTEVTAVYSDSMPVIRAGVPISEKNVEEVPVSKVPPGARLSYVRLRT